MFDRKELQIITQLRKDARMHITKMSKNTRIPISTIYDRIKNNKCRLMTRNVTLVDFTRLGFSCRVSIILRLKKKQKQELREHLLKSFNVNSLFKINNGYDYMIDAVFKNVKEVEEFMDDIDEKFSVAELKTYYIIDEIAREKFLSDLLHIDLVCS
ncbi:MAG: Lrp/AsnC family transcriptional regulator [Candidatus Nanoarchaeia archaeon]